MNSQLLGFFLVFDHQPWNRKRRLINLSFYALLDEEIMKEGNVIIQGTSQHVGRED